MNSPASSRDRTPDPAELGELAVALATGAADVVRRGIADGRTEVGSKSSDTDLVTSLDRAVERWLLDRLATDRPDDAVLGEETGTRSGTSRVRWVLDPIDGTVNFVLGIPAFAVSVAAERDGVVVAGAVCAPVSGELFSAVLGGGAWLTALPAAGAAPSPARRLSGPRAVPLERAVIGTGFGYAPAQRARQGVVAGALLGRVGDLRRIGSAALDLCYVAAGRLDAYYEVGLNAWDLAAGALVASEAGCVVDARPGALTAVAGASLSEAFFGVLAELGAADVLAGEDR